jgi:LPS O-antigen subunit length determinant protein (WzzB/FepE family)
MLAIQAAQGVAQYVGAKREAKDARKSAKESYALEQATLQERAMQTGAAATEKMGAIAQKGREELASLTTATGEAGVGGILTQRLATASQAATSEDIASAKGQLDADLSQIEMEKKASEATAKGRLRAARGPNLLTSMLGIAGQSAGTVAAFTRRRGE